MKNKPNMQNLFKIKTKKDQNKQQEVQQPPPGVSFEEASPDLDVFTQARMNLRSFKDYFSQTDIDAINHYQIVAASVSKAFANLTNKSAELELEKATHEKDMKSLLEDIKKQKGELQTSTEMVDEMKSRSEFLKSRHSDLQNQLDELTDTVSKRMDIKTKYDLAASEYDKLLAEFNEKKKILEDKKRVNEESSKEYEETKKALEEKQAKVDAELAESEQRVKELQAKAKKLEQEQEEAKRKAKELEKKKASKGKRRVSMAEKPVETYVIQDNLSVSNQEIEGLRMMVEQIEAENKALTEEYESKQMDIDCLQQQNLGLKQIIRGIVEPK